MKSDAPEAGAALKAREILIHGLRLNDAIPNNDRLPLLIYHAAARLDEADRARALEDLFHSHGWAGAWRNGILAYHHFHSVSHEVLGVYSGSAKAQFGGEGGPVVELQSGDVVIIPAGVGHKNLGASGDFGVVGAYPEGQEDYDLLRGSLDELEQAQKNIAQVPAPKADPVYGAGGPLFEHWK